MGLLDTLRSRLLFWRKPADSADPAAFTVDGCFTLPGAELGAAGPAKLATTLGKAVSSVTDTPEAAEVVDACGVDDHQPS